jgi:hypothetical protein
MDTAADVSAGPRLATRGGLIPTAAALCLALLLAVAQTGCRDDDKGKVAGASYVPTTEPTENVSGPKFADIDAAAAALSKLTGATVRNYSTYDYGRRQDERCRSVIVRSEEDASMYPPKIRPRLPLGLVCYVGTSTWLDGSDHNDGTEVVIGPGADQFDYVRLARTRGKGTGVDTEMIIRRLTNLNVQYGIDIVQAEADTVIFRWTRPPWNYAKAAEDVTVACPDLLGPFSELRTSNDLEAYLKRDPYVHFTWH